MVRLIMGVKGSGKTKRSSNSSTLPRRMRPAIGLH